ncbi:MAG: nuclear transport factor 2 family protein [Actinobacteria bacterium]|nr:nuclear transport factor 2 family protein [Actinomycetota bacterium]
MIDPGGLQDVIARWWWNYDEGNFDALAAMLADDAHFSCRTDTGKADWEDFVRADVRGRDAIMEWQSQHRLDSPYPLRHHGTNVHIVEQRGNEATFASYIHVTQIVEGQVAHLSSAAVIGAVREEGGTLRIADLQVVLDTMSSGLFRDLRTLKR